MKLKLKKGFQRLLDKLRINLSKKSFIPNRFPKIGGNS